MCLLGDGALQARNIFYLIGDAKTVTTESKWSAQRQELLRLHYVIVLMGQ